MRNCLLFALLLIFPVSSKAISLIDSVKNILGTTITKYQKFEVGIASTILDPSSSPVLNQFDPTSVDMYAIFLSPTGRQYRRDAFWYQPFERCNTCPNNIIQTCCGWNDVPERLNPADPDAYLRTAHTSYPWRIRFAPPEAGSWSYKVYVHSVFGTDSSASYSFTATNSSEKGYIGTDTITPSRYFKYKETGEVFIPLGVNCLRPGGTQGNDTMYNRIAMMTLTQMMEQMNGYGGNFLRTMMGPENFGIEWADGVPGGGMGNYTARQNRAFDLDSVFTKAEEEKVYLQLVLYTNGESQIDDWWKNHPYRTVNGGCVTNMNDFFTDATAKAAFKNRLRYIIARWGYSPYLHSWEIMQEIELYGTSVNGGYFWANKNNVRSWYREMIQYMKTKDTNHLFVISMSNNASGKWDVNNDRNEGMYAIPEVDVINDHHYGRDYNIGFQRNYVERQNTAYYPKKPMMWGEAAIQNVEGLNFRGNHLWNDNDWHNLLWSTCFGGGAGPGLSWESFVDIVHPNCWGGQYRYFTPLKAFLEGDSIFYQDPLPIANTCTGSGRHDMRPAGQPWGYDSLNNRCSCFPAWVVEENHNPQFVSGGTATTNDSLIEVFGLKTDTRVIGWIHHKQNYWYMLPHTLDDPAFGDNVLDIVNAIGYPDSLAIPVLNNDSVAIHNLATGAYQLSFYSTWPDYEINENSPGPEDGGVIPAFTDTVYADCSGMIKFRVPKLTPLLKATTLYAPDYGFKLTWLSPVTATDIQTNTTWNTSSYIPGDVTVHPGATLIISGSSTVIKMPQDGKIIVRPGAKLIIDGATITTDCDRMWYGIQAVGQTNQRQLYNLQGFVDIRNSATIEHARFAVTNSDGSWWSNTGGIIKASNSHFLNNKKSIQFLLP